MRRRDDGTWDGASPPRCRFAPPTPGTESRRATVTEASRPKAFSAETRAEPERVADPYVAELSWTPSGFIPDHENNIVAHLFPSRRTDAKTEARGDSAEPAFQRHRDDDADDAETEAFSSRNARRDDDAENLDESEAAALIAAAERDPSVFAPIATVDVTRTHEGARVMDTEGERDDVSFRNETTHSPASEKTDADAAMINNVVSAVGDSVSSDDSVSNPTTAIPAVSPSSVTKRNETKRGAPIVFVTSEVAPWSKTGGLGDVCGALPAALAKRGHAVLVVSPLYEPYEGCEEIGRCEFVLSHANQTVRYFRMTKEGVTYVFCQHPALQRGGGGRIYGASPGNPYPDNAFRFALLCLAAIESLLCVPWGELFFGGGVDGETKRDAFYFTSAPVFVANDWHGALTPVFLAARYQSRASTALAPRAGWAPEGAPEALARARAVTIVHNLFHLGVFPSDFYKSLGLPEEHEREWFPSLRWRWSDGGECMNFLKAGVALSAATALVSPAYARETQTRALGCGMDEVLRSVGNHGSSVDLGPLNGKLSDSKLVGVVNGVDVAEWDPATDSHLPANYAADVRLGETRTCEETGRVVLDARAGKAACKRALQLELGLDVDPDAPLIGFIGRLDGQKGVDVLLASVPRLVELGAQIVLLGSGDPGLEEGLRHVERAFRGRAVGWVGFSVPVSHRITAAVDILAMPSRFEPCGLNQLYALRYGAAPVAHATGGLRDTVTKDVGFPFAPCEPGPLTEAVERAIRVYRRRGKEGENGDEGKWDRMRARAMRKDLSWNVAAAKYERVFEKAAAPAPFAMNRRAVAASNPALAAARDAEDTAHEWRDAERRAEKMRRKAARAPNRDTREGDRSEDSNLLWRVTSAVKSAFRR